MIYNDCKIMPNTQREVTQVKKLILDLDTGVDDTLAISYALGSPEMELIGITGTYGNVFVTRLQSQTYLGIPK